MVSGTWYFVAAPGSPRCLTEKATAYGAVEGLPRQVRNTAERRQAKPQDRSPDYFSFAFGHKLLNKYILLLTLKQFNNGFCRFDGLGKKNTNALGTFN